jgi:hypothetical protein
MDVVNSSLLTDLYERRDLVASRLPQFQIWNNGADLPR